MEKKRVDVLLVEQGLFESRQRAQAAIMAGEVLDHNSSRIDKAGEKFSIEEQFILKQMRINYVSRGALKLKKAIEFFNIDLQDLTCLDIGASTGGFTDVALRNGAKMVYALDVGYNQLAYKLRQDPRVEVMERVNFRYSKPEDFKLGRPDFAMTDVSFISLKHIFPPMHDILKDEGTAVCLIKPQFEAGKENVGKNGIIHDKKVHLAVVEKVIEIAMEDKFDILNLSYSPITGGHGNIEFLVYLKKSAEPGQNLYEESIASLVDAAHQQLDGLKNEKA